MSKNSEPVIIKLDKPRVLRFGHKALKQLKAMTGKTLIQIDETIENLDPEEIEVYMYCGLLVDAKSNNEDLTLEKVEDILEQADNYRYIIEKLAEAVGRSFGADGEEVKNMIAMDKQKK
ncbi:hypothetical protein [Bacillus sp. UNCCL81]|uniref:hypothetical protein n=1 Tax=Bacillus sp. UNCCL81 TaxID=1502755 RepID=UPI0008E98928|nr:hypothetical protein [Bacillus sp. UNCCL81]SFD44027.1 hypothetical protein SAMN02799633_03821 [Bacillus sp. UNCCL81]